MDDRIFLLEINDGSAFKQVMDMLSQNHVMSSIPMIISSQGIMITGKNHDDNLHVTIQINSEDLLHFQLNHRLVNHQSGDSSYHQINFNFRDLCGRIGSITKRESFTLAQMADSEELIFCKGQLDTSSSSGKIKVDMIERVMFQPFSEMVKERRRIQTISLSAFIAPLIEVGKIKNASAQFQCYPQGIKILGMSGEDRVINQITWGKTTKMIKRGDSRVEEPESIIATVQIHDSVVRFLTKMNTKFNSCGIVRVYCYPSPNIICLESQISSFGLIQIHLT